MHVWHAPVAFIFWLSTLIKASVAELQFGYERLEKKNRSLLRLIMTIVSTNYVMTK